MAPRGSAAARAEPIPLFPGAGEPAPLVVVSGRNGEVVLQNDVAERALGIGSGRKCWDLMPELDGAEGLPCMAGCARRLLARGPGTSVHAAVRVREAAHQLTCVAVDDRVVSVCSPRPAQPRADWMRVTPRESEVLALVADGLTNAQISRELGLSEATVRAHVEHMRVRLGVTTRAALVAACLRTGIIE